MSTETQTDFLLTIERAIICIYFFKYTSVIVVVDNYSSFSSNSVHYMRKNPRLVCMLLYTYTVHYMSIKIIIVISVYIL